MIFRCELNLLKVQGVGVLVLIMPEVIEIEVNMMGTTEALTGKGGPLEIDMALTGKGGPLGIDMAMTGKG